MRIRRTERAVLAALAIHVLIGAASEAAVVANFTWIPPDPVCGEVVQFIDTSTGDPTFRDWDFNNDGGTDSTLENPTWIFPTAGTYPVTLTVGIPPLDIDSITKNVVVGECGPEPGELSFTMASYSVPESGGVASISVRRTGGSSGAVTVLCQTVAGGTATAGVDYTVTMDVLTWSDGDTANKSCTIPIVDDTVAEPNETLFLTLTNATGGATVGVPGTAVLTIIDDGDDFSELSFSTTAYQYSEDIGVAQVAVRRTGGSSGAVSVRCNTSDGTATAPEDYEATMDTLTWADGSTTDRICTIPIVDDTDDEADETLNLFLSDPTGGAVLGSPSTAVLTIADNDLFSDGFESGDTAAWSVTAGGSRWPQSVQGCSVSADFTWSPTNPTPGQPIQFTDTSTGGPTDWQWDFDNDGIIDSTAQNPTHTFANPGAYAIKLTVLVPPACFDMITKIIVVPACEPGQLSFKLPDYQIGEGGGLAGCSVRRTGGSCGAVSVRCETQPGTATPGVDYTPTSDTLTWANGDTANRVCSVPIVDDDQVEGDETFLLVLSNFIGATPGSPIICTVTILDDELGLIFVDDFESGDATAWSSTQGFRMAPW